ncbi:MAG: dihydrolipoamide succinyltransferase [Azospirillum brasilense]|nr:MAG: dihydrolipoamide succinyltransferase [Azospirillum brasilense]
MSIEIRVPTLGESVSEATIGRWFKKPGEAVKADEPLVELETDKVTVEVNAPADGVLAEIVVNEGETVGVDTLLGSLGEAGGAAPAASPAVPSAAPPAAAVPASKAADSGPAVARLSAESGVDPAGIPATGKDGRVTKGDMLQAMTARSAARPAPAPVPAPRPAAPAGDAAREERVRMSKLRQTIARRLKEAQSTAAILTTFNEVDMSAMMGLRSRYKEAFEKKHGVKLGFMGFFVKACVQALKEIPAVNAEIDGTDIIYRSFCHIGVAVGTEKGLVVPVVRDADRLSIAGIERKIGEFGKRARDGQLTIEEMQGGTFTISNGGVYGSLMSMPILNAPQSAILGMHKIQERPVAVAGKVEIRPMMYLALSYDHRIIDGKEAVTFLVRVKEALEDPARLVLDL